jgi:hypothetical protein
MHETECLALHVLCRLSKSGSQPHDPVLARIQDSGRKPGTEGTLGPLDQSETPVDMADFFIVHVV